MLVLVITSEIEKKNYPKWDFELGSNLNRLADLSYALSRYTVQELLQMEDENPWKGLEMHLLVCFIQAGLADSHRLAQ